MNKPALTEEGIILQILETHDKDSIVEEIHDLRIILKRATDYIDITATEKELKLYEEALKRVNNG